MARRSALPRDPAKDLDRLEVGQAFDTPVVGIVGRTLEIRVLEQLPDPLQLEVHKSTLSLGFGCRENYFLEAVS